MIKPKRLIALAELVLVSPAALFMCALFARNLQPQQYQPAKAAAALVDWFSARPVLCLDIFLIALPFAVMVVGCTTLLRSWWADPKLRNAALQTIAAIRAHLATALIAGATLLAAGILTIVAVHVLTD